RMVRAEGCDEVDAGKARRIRAGAAADLEEAQCVKIEPAGRSTRWRRLSSGSRKNNTRPPPPAGLTGSENCTPRAPSVARVDSMESTRSATCRQPASELTAVSFRDSSAW